MSASQSTISTSLPSITGYTLIETIYSSARTVVYRALRSHDSQPVIIKALQQEHPSFGDLVKFRNQYSLTQNLPITNIVRPLSLEPWRNGYALVMEDSGGQSLSQYITTHSLSLIETLSIGVQMASILHELGQHRLIHKDIKPANILIHPQSRQIKLTDFSISSLLPKETQQLHTPTQLAKGLEGTLAYLAPEQTGRMNRGIDYRADFYALGVTLYELLVGELPFQFDDPLALIHAHIATPPIPPYQREAKIPGTVSEIVLKLMAKNAEDRYQSALGIKHDLEKCLYQLKETEQIEPFELAQQDVCDRFLIPEKLYGRQKEVEALLSAFENAADGSAEMMLVAGFSGIGKTAVVNEVHKPITRRQGYFIRGKFDQLNRNLPLSAFIQAFQGLLKQLLSEPETQLSMWRNQILEAVGDDGQLLIEVIPELETIIGAQPAAAELSGGAAQNRFNRLLQKFVGVFSTSAHPLVMFLDDLQWADSASLHLIEQLLNQRDQGHLFIIGAYRDNEVSLAHPLMLTLSKLTQAKVTLNTITLAPLSQESLNQLVADTLQCLPEATASVAQLIYQKTKGNPFFSTQFLKSLYDDELITFDWETGLWQCDVAQVKQLALTDDVVEFMASQLKKFSTETQTAIKLAACIGNQFDLTTLAIVYGQSQTTTATTLWPAIQAGLIVPTSEVYKFYQVQKEPGETLSLSQADQLNQPDQLSLSTYRFLHDRVQQAAYSLIPEDQKQMTHFKLGQRLSQTLSAEEQAEKLFEIVNQLNFGLAFIDSPAEKKQLIELNLAAGRKAKLAIAYEAAIAYFDVGRSLLPENSWKEQYALTLALYEAAAEVAYLNGDFEQSEQLSSVVLQQAKTLLDQVNVYVIKIQSYIAQSKLIDAIQIALPLLPLLDEEISLPETPTATDFEKIFIETQTVLADRSTADLLALPEMKDPTQLAVMRILSCIASPAYLAFPAMMPLIAMKMVNLSVKYGNTPTSAFAYAMYGFILCGIVNDIESGYSFGQLAMALCEKANAKPIKAKVLLLIGHFINLWQDPMLASLQQLPEAYQVGIASGDLEFAGYAAAFYCYSSIFAGKELEQLMGEMTGYSEAIAPLKQDHVLPQIQLARQVANNLLTVTAQPNQLVGEYYDESVMVPQHKQTKNITSLAFVYIAKLHLSYLFENYEQAAENAALAKPYLDGVVGMPCTTWFNLYESLTKLALYPQVEATEQSAILAQVANNQNKMKYWADRAPVNCLHKFELVEAERDRILGNRAEAIEHYDLAIAGAAANSCAKDEALANELAAKFYLSWGKAKVAEAYMQTAYYGYARWGAKAKLAHLEQHYGHLLGASLQQNTSQKGNTLSHSTSDFSTASLSFSESLHSLTYGTQASRSASDSWLDLTTVMKAAQAISQEIELEKLLAMLMQTVITQAGAQRGWLVLSQEKQWQIVAGGEQAQSQLVQSPLEHFTDLPQSLIYSVVRSHQIAVFDDLTLTADFAGDRYVIAHKPRSVLCTPISRQGQLIGILYLENNATAGAFTRDRIELLQLLTSQAAISIENARLYEKTENYSQTLEAEVARKTEALNKKAQDLEQTLVTLKQTQAQLIQTEKMSSIGQMVAGVAHEINNPINFIKGNIKHTRQYMEDIVSLLSLYQRDYPQPGDEIQELAEDLDVDFLVKDAMQTFESMALGSDRIQQIVLSLRNFSRLDEAEVKAVDLHEGLESTLSIIQSKLQATDQAPAIHIVKDYGELPKVSCYASQLNQVFLNILNNAIDAVRDGTLSEQLPKIQITTGLTEHGEVRIAIANNGSPISAEIQPRIFDPFFTTKAVGSGTGLGLFVSYSTIQNHQGQLSVSSSEGTETVFEIILPQ